MGCSLARSSHVYGTSRHDIYPLHAIPTNGVPYLDFVAPGILAQSVLFVSTSMASRNLGTRRRVRSPNLTGEPDAPGGTGLRQGVRGGACAGRIAQAAVVYVFAAILGVDLSMNPVRLLGVVVAVILGGAFFCCLSLTIAGLVLSPDRMMGIGQAITMPLFFASNALFPVALMPDWLRAISHVNPLSYQVDALRGLLLGTPARLPLDFAVLATAVGVGVAVASSLLGRLTW